MNDEKITITSTTSPDDRQRKRLDQIRLRDPTTGSETGVALHSHPIWQFNPEYAKYVIFKMENIQRITGKADVLRVMGYPLLTAGLHLFDLGINTLDSSPHAYPTDEAPDVFYAYIDIEVTSLKVENKKIAVLLVKEGFAEFKDVQTHFWSDEPIMVYRLKFPISRETKPEEIQKQSIAVAERFLKNN